MRKLLTIAVVALSAALGAGMADAQQIRIQPYVNQGVMMPRVNRIPKIPRLMPLRPRINMLPPSAALKRAMGTMPGAKPIGVKLRNQTYIVRLKSGGTITQLGVDSVTGTVMPLP